MATTKAKKKNPQQKQEEALVEKLLASLEEGVKPWEQPWQEGRCAPFANLFNQDRPYRGTNILICAIDAMFYGYTQPYWLGLKQIQDMGWHLKKGSKATYINFSSSIFITKKDENGEEVLDASGNLVQYQQPFRKSFKVFNVDCVDDSKTETKVADFLPPEEELTPVSTNEELESFIEAQEASIKYTSHPVLGMQACYVPGRDEIYIPPNEYFKTSEGRYATIFHELSHWTGHRDRLNRPGITGQKSREAYAYEELIAELAAALVCNEFGIAATLENHTSYINTWISLLKGEGDKKYTLLKAFSEARKAKAHLFDNWR